MRHDSIERAFAAANIPQLDTDRTATDWIGDHHITGSDGERHDIQLSYIALGDYGIERDPGDPRRSLHRLGRWWMVAVNAMSCPVSSDCGDAHSMLMVMRRTERSIPYSWEFYDATLAVLHNFDVTNVPRLDSVHAQDWQVAATSAAENVMGSMQFRNSTASLTDGYAATVYDDHITFIRRRFPYEERGGVAYVLPGHRHLVSYGESTRVEFPDAHTIWAYTEDFHSHTGMENEQLPYDTNSDGRRQRERSVYGAHPEPKTATDTEIMSSPAIPDQSTSELRTAVDRDMLAAKDARIAELERIIEQAREAELERTLQDSGCNDGKTSFLLSTGLHGNDYNEIMRGIVCPERDYLINVQVSMVVSIPVTMSEDDADNVSGYNYEEFFEQGQIDDAICELVRSTNVDNISFDSIDEA